MKRIQLEIEGMSCGHCLAAVREALVGIPGVSIRDVRIGSASVLMDPAQTNIGVLIDAVQDAGYEARETAG